MSVTSVGVAVSVAMAVLCGIGGLLTWKKAPSDDYSKTASASAEQVQIWSVPGCLRYDLFFYQYRVSDFDVLRNICRFRSAVYSFVTRLQDLIQLLLHMACEWMRVVSCVYVCLRDSGWHEYFRSRGHCTAAGA